MMAKRGLKLNAVHFESPPYTSERARIKVEKLLKQVSRYAGSIEMHTVPLTKVQEAMRDRCPEELFTILLRRVMMKISTRIANETKSGALITGESLGQVASQTLSALAVTNEVCTLPVFRPLIGFDNEEIVQVSKKIGTYETSILPYEDCCTIFVAKHPVTKPKADVIRKHEHYLDEKIDEMVERAIETDEIINVSTYRPQE
jgi:thiamine biosynthesis protein ThiI